MPALHRALKLIPQRELDVPAIRGRPADLAERGGAETRARLPQVHMVEDVEHLRAELDLVLLVDREILEDAEIEIHGARSGKYVAAQVAVRECRGRCQGRRVEPKVHRALRFRQFQLAHEVWTL